MDEMNQLAQLWKLPTGAFLQGMGAMENVRANDDEALKQQQLKTMFSQQNDPQRLREQDLQNQTLEAQLPGVRAQSSMYEDKAKYSKATNDTAIDDFLKSSKDKVGAQQLKRLTDATQAYGLAGGAMNSIPPAARHAYARQMMGEFYNPELFDRVPPEALPKMLQTMASESTTFSQKVQAKLQEQAALAQSRAQLQAQKDAAASERASALQEYKLKLKQVSDSNQKSNNPKTFEAAAVWAQQQAMNEPDPAKRAALVEFAQQQITLKNQLAVNAGAARKPGELDTGAATGMAVVPPGPVPQVKPIGPPASSPQAASAPAAAVTERPLRQAVSESGYPWEPEKYDYRIGPDGKAQRKPKGQ